jgi:membrane protease YdiL (CAAX protease family)
LTAGLILTGGRRAWIIRWLSRPRRSWGWSLAAVIIGLLPLFLLAAGPGTGKTMQLAPWIIFVLVNPWFEEWYWRGLLLDAASIWPEWLGIVYAGVMFAFSYPLVWGVFFESGRAPAFILITLTAGILWGVVYRRTGSLRWVVIGHLLLDVFGLAAPILWNLHFPI